LGIGDWAQSPIPNPQSPSPIPPFNTYLICFKLFILIIMSSCKVRSIVKTSKQSFCNINNTGSMMLLGQHNNLRVISTPEFPVPYYQRIIRHPASREQVTLDLRKIQYQLDENIVITTKEKLSKTSEGLKVLDFVNNKVALDSFMTEINSIEVQAEIYSNDLLNYIDSAHEENCRIMAEVDLADCFKH